MLTNLLPAVLRIVEEEDRSAEVEARRGTAFLIMMGGVGRGVERKGGEVRVMAERARGENYSVEFQFDDARPCYGSVQSKMRELRKRKSGGKVESSCHLTRVPRGPAAAFIVWLYYVCPRIHIYVLGIRTV